MDISITFKDFKYARMVVPIYPIWSYENQREFGVTIDIQNLNEVIAPVKAIYPK